MLTKYNETLSYKIVDNGYEIYNNGELWITQYDQYSHVYKADGTFEENCLLQLKELEEGMSAVLNNVNTDEDVVG